MQSFRVSKKAKKWFDHIRTPKALQTDFDVLYFCFVVGIVTRRQRELTNEFTSELTVAFPDSYKAKSKLLVALLLKAKLDARGISLNDRGQVHRAISRYVAPDSPNHMNAEGVKEFCKYSHGGFEVLKEWFDSQPRKLETFLRSFRMRVDEACRRK